MTDFDYRQIDPVLHSRIRLSITSLLSGVEEAEFTYIRDTVGITDGNMTTHMKRLEEEGYLSVKKIFAGRKPVTYYSLTGKGREKLREYVETIGNLLKGE
jgi:DNA-binding MarR family transcriptional regulator